MNQPKKERFKTSVGGQALMEGIMMRGPKQMCCAVRKPDGTIETKLDPTPAHGVWMKIPLVRGAIAMIESMIVGYRYMMYSAQVSMGDDYDPAEEETAFEKWVGEHLGEKAENALLTVAAVLGGLLAILLFTVLPTFLVGGVNRLLPLGRWGKVVLEAVLKVAIFLTYMVGISKMKEFIDSAPTEEWKAQASVTLACRLMNGGKADQAASLFRSVVDSGDPTFSAFATMCLGDIARAGKDSVAAGTFYRELAEKFPSSAFVLDLQRNGYVRRKALFDVQSPVRIEPVADKK